EDRPRPPIALLEGRVAASVVAGRRLGPGAGGALGLDLLPHGRYVAVEPLHQVPVEVVAEQFARLCRGEPADLVHLAVREEAPADRGHQPVAHEFGTPAAVLVARLAQLAPERGPDAGLLLHLAQRGLLEGLARLELALGQAPVVVFGAVDDCYLGLAVGAQPAQDAPGRRYVHVGDR